MGSSRKTLFVGCASVSGLLRCILGASQPLRGLVSFHWRLNIAPENLVNPLRPQSFPQTWVLAPESPHSGRGQVWGQLASPSPCPSAALGARLSRAHCWLPPPPSSPPAAFSAPHPRQLLGDFRKKSHILPRFL